MPGERPALATNGTERVRRRSTLLLLVFAASLTLVALTAVALVTVVSQRLTAAAIDSSVRSDQTLVRSFAASSIRPSDLRAAGVDPARVAWIEDEIAGFIERTDGIVHIKVWAPDGTVLYSERRELRGQNLGLDDDITDAIAGQAVSSTIEDANQGEAATSDLPPGTKVLEEYIPIEIDGSVPGVFEIYRNAARILTAVDDTRRDVLVVTLAAGAVLALLLYLIFRATQARLNRQTAELLEASRRDALTGLLNHGSAVAELATLLERSRPAGTPVGVALVDIDNFRLLNDTYGHHAGDRALAEVARALKAELSQATTVGRYGPDEFLVVAPPQCVHDLEPAIDRLRARIGELSLQFGGSERLPVTVSGGVCYSPTNGEAATELLAVATGALGEAKASGGNDVRVASLTSDDLAVAQRSSFEVLTGLVEAVDTKDRYTKQHSEDVARYAVFLAGRIGFGPDELPVGRAGGAAPRRRQDRDPGRDPAQARPAHDRRVPHRQAARLAGRRDRPRPAGRRDGPGGCPPPPRALGRDRLPRRPGRRGDPADRPDRVGGRRVQRDDDHPPVPQGAVGRGGARSPPRGGRDPARPPPRRHLRDRHRDRRRPTAARGRPLGRPAMGADVERRLT